MKERPILFSGAVPTKALSVRQPWAWLIVHGHKDIENRTWPTRFRGRVLIHASKGMTRAEYEDAADFAYFHGGVQQMTTFEEMERGGIVGVATITDCTDNSGSRWHMPDCLGFKLVDAKPLPFVPCKGALGFFDVPADVLAAYLEQNRS